MNLSTFKDLTRFEQTLFGLPYLMAGALLPFVYDELPLSLSLLWIFPAFLFARISGMAFNQLIDSSIDAKNPRTNNRAIPSKKVTVTQAKIIAWGTLFLFMLTCFQINMLCLSLAPFAALLLFVYSYLKRMTASVHFVLGVIHFLCPMMASIAVSGRILMAPFFLGLSAACSIIGNDIIYAVQDMEFDRKHHLFSFPAQFGIEKSFLVARVVHIMCLLFLFLVGITAHLPIFFYVLIPVVGAIFYQFHKKVEKEIHDSLFFSCAVAVSFSVFGFVLASVLWDVM